MKVYNIHTLLKAQVLDTISDAILLRLIVQIPVCCCFHWPLLLIFVKPNSLQTLVDIETKVSILIEVLPPLGYELFLRLFCLGRNTHDSLSKKLKHAFLEGLNPWVSCANRKKTLHKRLQVCRL